MIKGKHTVEKVGGTSMSDFDAACANIFIGSRKGKALYNRIFVVSAYAGVTNRLLEDKKSGEPGLFEIFRASREESAWQKQMDLVRQTLHGFNRDIFADKSGLCKKADAFIAERLDTAESALRDVSRLVSFGQFDLANMLNNVKEILASIGEAHSAFNTVLMLRARGVNARFVDLTGWQENQNEELEERITRVFDAFDLSMELPVVTGYAYARSGMIKTYGRGYSEVTFSRVACLTGAREAIIHKEFHLSSADPKIVGELKAVPIGRTNFDVADQLANMGMEAIHPNAAKGLRQNDIPLRVKNTFEPDHQGTVFLPDWSRKTAQAEMITGRDDIYAIEIFEQNMVGEYGHEKKIAHQLDRFGIRSVSVDMNANSITHYVAKPLRFVRSIASAIEHSIPGAEVRVRHVAMVAVIGADLGSIELIAKAASALSAADISIIAMQQSSRRKDLRFIVKVRDMTMAIRILHAELVETVARKASDDMASGAVSLIS